MRRRALWHLTLAVLASVALAASLFALRHRLPAELAEPLGLRADISEIRRTQTPLLSAALEDRGLSFGAPVYLRIFKEDRQLELWVEAPDGFRLFRSYEICAFSGDLGPKLREGDRQSPEGFYEVRQGALNPASAYHLSFNLGFPNAYDRAQGRSGSFLMVHGNCLSVGCYAMTDAGIEEIYVLVEAALRGGQDFVPVHAFPFRPTSARMARAAASPWHGFWTDLASAYQLFDTTTRLPQIKVTDGRYRIVGG